MVERYTPLVHANAEIKFQATAAHLWFEEIISGDPYLKIGDIWKHLDQAQWYARAMLDGGENLHGKYIPLEDPILRSGIEQTLQGLAAFRAIAQQRWQLRSQSGVGSDIDQRFDKTFNDFLAIIDKVEITLYQTINLQLQRFRLLQNLLILVIVILGVLIGIVLQRHERRHIKDLLVLQNQEENLRITLDSIGDGVIATDAKGIITRMNPVAEQLTGWSFNDADGQELKIVFSVVDANTNQKLVDPIEKVIATGKTVSLSNHTTLIAKDGTKRQITDSAAPMHNKGQFLGVVLVFSDVSEKYLLRKTAETSAAQVTLLLNSTAEAIYGIDMNGRCTFVNQACLDMLGYANDSELLNENMHNLIHHKYPDGSHYPVENCHIFRAFQKELKTHIDNEVLWRKDGTSFATEYWSHPIFKDNECMGAVVTFLDITDKKRADEMARRSQKMDAIGKLTGGIAHDYNNMLGVIMGYAELLGNQLSDQPKLASYAHAIRIAGERGSKLTQKLLAFSRKKSSDTERIELNTLLLHEQHMLEKTLTVRIKLIMELSDNLWPVWLDSGDFENAIINMSINAMHAIEGNGQLIFQTRNLPIDEIDARLLRVSVGDYVLLSISDTGCGMNEITKEKIFDPFFTTKGEKGTGLGLSQVYGFIQRSNGFIKVYSRLGHGTKFALYFPRYIEHSKAQVVAIEKTAAKITRTETILVVDDELALLSLTCEMLNRQGYQIFNAQSAKEALVIIEKENIELLLTDIIMPEMDGYQLAAQVQEKNPEIKIQLVSGFADGRHSNMVNDDLIQNMLHKPFNTKTLLQRIRSLLDK